MSTSIDALFEAQFAFQGVADKIGVKTEQDVIDMVKEIRSERSGGY